MKKKFEVISLHFDNKCNLNCKGCYIKAKKNKEKKPHSWFLQLPKYMKESTSQVALGGGEPFLSPDFIEKFSAECKKHNIITNITTNGKLIRHFSDKQLKRILKNVTMVSVSFDKHKIKTLEDIKIFTEATKKLSKYVKVGCNVLLDEKTLRDLDLFCFVLFNYVERIFLLHPKPYSKLNIEPYLHSIYLLSKKHKHLYVDSSILQFCKYGYQKWKMPCHYGKKVVSINYNGDVSGCSFAPKEFTLKKPQDILRLGDYKFKERWQCINEIKN